MFSFINFSHSLPKSSLISKSFSQECEKCGSWIFKSLWSRIFGMFSFSCSFGDVMPSLDIETRHEFLYVLSHFTSFKKRISGIITLQPAESALLHCGIIFLIKKSSSIPRHNSPNSTNNGRSIFLILGSWLKALMHNSFIKTVSKDVFMELAKFVMMLGWLCFSYNVFNNILANVSFPVRANPDIPMMVGVMSNDTRTTKNVHEKNLQIFCIFDLKLFSEKLL